MYFLVFHGVNSSDSGTNRSLLWCTTLVRTCKFVTPAVCVCRTRTREICVQFLVILNSSSPSPFLFILLLRLFLRPYHDTSHWGLQGLCANVSCYSLNNFLVFYLRCLKRLQSSWRNKPHPHSWNKNIRYWSMRNQTCAIHRFESLLLALWAVRDSLLFLLKYGTRSISQIHNHHHHYH